MTKLYLIRHAEAEGNLYRIAHGQYNSILTNRGYRQVEALQARFADIPVDAVYASDLCRTCSTARAVYIPKGLPLQRRRDLREICMGAWEQMSWGEIERSAPGQLTHFTRRLDLWHVEGAETAAQVRDRLLGAVREIAAANPGRTVAVFSHGAALRILLGTLQGFSLEEIGQTQHGDNTAVSLVEAEGDTLRVVFRDDNSHIQENLSTFAGQEWWKRPNAIEPGLAFDALDGARQAACAKEYGFTPAEGRPVLLASLEGEPVGLLQLDPGRGEAEGQGWISAYTLLPRWRRQGYGIQLLGQAVKHYRPLGRDRVCVALGAGEETARRFAARYGFREAGADGGGTVFEKAIGYPAFYPGELEV